MSDLTRWCEQIAADYDREVNLATRQSQVARSDKPIEVEVDYPELNGALNAVASAASLWGNGQQPSSPGTKEVSRE